MLNVSGSAAILAACFDPYRVAKGKKAMARNSDESRDPIKERPLRNPGQSLEKQIDDFVSDGPMAWVVVISISVAYVGMEWFRWLFNDQLRPLTYTFCGLGIVLFAFWRIRVAIADIQNL